MNIQLSISLLASDKPAALERCLDSLKPLLMQVPSELIIVITGKDERIRKIASNYTDQIVFFTWCDDFSAARNAGLKLARGEWFLFIDDDEWFEDTTEICRFFLSGEYRRYGMARYIQRNYIDWQGKVYLDFDALRMVKMVPGIHFQNPIHEEPVPRGGLCKEFNTHVHHYGHIKNKKNTSSEKSSRNITLLLEDIQKRPSYAKNYVQIVQEYRQARNWEKAEFYSREGLKRCRKSELLPFRRWLQTDLIEIIYEKEERQKAKEEILDLLEQYKPCEMVRMIGYLTLNKIYIKLGEPEQALHYGELYEDTLTYMDQNPELWSQQECGYLTEMKIKHPSMLYKMRINCVEQALACGNKKKAVYFLKLLPWEDETKIQQFYYIFDYLKETYAELFSDVLRDLSVDSAYLLLEKVINTENMEKEKRQELLEQCMRKTQFYHLQYRIVKEAVLSETDVSGIVSAFELDTWEQCVSELVNDVSDAELLKVWQIENTLKSKAYLHVLLLERVLRERELIRGYFTGQRLISALSEYADCILSYYGEQYLTEMFRAERKSLLPKECRFGMFLSEALQKLKLKEFPEAVRLFRTALSLNPAMTGVIQEVLRLITGMLNDPALAAGEEFQALAVQMKETLRSLIQNKQYQEAFSVMQQLCTLLPSDLELLKLRQKLFLEMDT